MDQVTFIKILTHLIFQSILSVISYYFKGKYIFGCFDNRDMEEAYKVVYDNV